MAKPFRDAKAVYHRLGPLFRELLDDPDYGHMAKGSVIRFRLTEPEAVMKLNCRKVPPEIACGATDGPADLDMGMPAGLLHEVLSGKAGLGEAYRQGLIQVRGSIFKLISLKPLFDAAAHLYQRKK